MAEERSTFEPTFSFISLPSKKFSFLQDKDVLMRLMKWSMLGRISAQSFSFDQTFYSYNSEKFALSFFRDPDVVFNLKKMEAGDWAPLNKPVVSVHVEAVPCTRVSMDLFDPIFTCGVLRPSGHVIKCFHEVLPDYDELRQMLQDDTSKHFHVLGREERAEFLFLLFKHLCLGGELCQYEETVHPYMDITRQVYKDLISVQKDPATKKISVVSTVLKVSAYDESGRCFPGLREEEQTFAYLIIDPFKRQVTLLCHIYGFGNMTL